MDTEKTSGSGEPIRVDVLNRQGEVVDQFDLNPSVFDVEVKPHLMLEAVKYQQAKHRAGTGSSKTRGDVAGSKKKPWRQKGTGRARSGMRKSPIWRGGGVIFGPHPRDFSINVPKKVRKAALKSALTQKRKDEKLTLISELTLERIKTAELLDWLGDAGIGENALVVIAEADKNVELSARNLPRIKAIRAVGINVRDVLLHDKLILTKAAAQAIQEALS